MARIDGSCIDCGERIPANGKAGPSSARCTEHKRLHNIKRYRSQRLRKYEAVERRTSCVICSTPFGLTSGARGVAKRTSSLKNICDSERCQRDYYYFRGLGVEPGTYDRLYAEQEGRCKLCTRHYERLSLDHCHATMNVRGLLCKSCNGALGHLGDNQEGLKRALAYVTAGGQ